MGPELIALLIRVTIAASVAVVVMLAARTMLRNKFGARVCYAFWAVVPVAAFAALLPARRIFEVSDLVATPPTVDVSGLAPTVAPGPVNVDPASALSFLGALPAPEALLPLLWAVGVVVSVSLLVIRQRRFLHRHDLIGIRSKIHVARDADIGPFVVGVLRPRIVVPGDFDERYSELERELIIEHEQAHIRSGDILANAFAAFLKCLNWFNPLAYAAFTAFRVDQELACDERVMGKHGAHRKAYAETLLKAQQAATAVPLGCDWSPDGARSLKSRITRLGRGAPAPARRMIGIAACAAAAIAAGTAAWAALPPKTVYVSSADENAEQVADKDRAFEDARARLLLEAALTGRREMVRELIAAGVDINHHIRSEGTPLVMAAQRGDVAGASALLDAGADVNGPAPADGNPLIVAAARGDLELARLLVERGADVNAYVFYDETPLINAAARNQLDMARYLIAQGADVNLAVDSGNKAPQIHLRSPLGEARRAGHREMIALLIENGAVRSGTSDR